MLGCVYIYIIAFRQSHVVVAVVFHQFSCASSSIYVPSNPRMPPNKKLSSLGVDEIGHIIYIWVNYNDLTVLPHWRSWLVRGIIPKWPKISG
jgi:hypothetical protein